MTRSTPTFLTPADARAAFASGAVDAWAIWDPFQASAEQTLDARELANAEGLAPNYQFYLGDRDFVDTNPEAIDALIAAIGEIDTWIAGNPRAAAEELAPSTGIPADALELALSRQSFGVELLTPEVIADQQKVADTFAALGLLPRPVRIEEAAGF